ncbi:MAG: ATP F0F1 synthase subunit B [Beijerinckiaceae bacterium]|nr:ATP F0F1 synthase subunit B [Beijerinckiaceae bacterium]
MHFDSSFFVAVGFALFLLLLGYFGVHTLLAGKLDDRGRRIQAELDEASKLRAEAESVLASYKARAAAAEAEAEAIVAQAREEAEAMARESAIRMEEFVARRTKQAELKIAMAETQATNEVRAAAADAAVLAAEKVLRIQTRGEAAAELVVRGIEDVRKNLAH